MRAACWDEDCFIGVLLKVPGLHAFLLFQHGPVLARQIEGLQQPKTSSARTDLTAQAHVSTPFLWQDAVARNAMQLLNLVFGQTGPGSDKALCLTLPAPSRAIARHAVVGDKGQRRHLVMDGVQDVVQVHGAALPLELLRMAAQEALHGGAAASRPDVPHRARAPVAVCQAPPSVPAILRCWQSHAQLPPCTGATLPVFVACSGTASKPHTPGRQSHSSTQQCTALAATYRQGAGGCVTWGRASGRRAPGRGGRGRGARPGCGT